MIYWLFGILVLGVGAFVLVAQSAPKDAMHDEAMMQAATTTEMMDGTKKDDAMMESGGKDDEMKEGAMMEKGSYEAYAPEKIALAADSKVVLFFHADWCPICRPIDAELKAKGAPAGVVVLKVDYDTAPLELKKKYGVTYQHTFVQVNAKGDMIAKWGDAFTLTDVLARIK